MAVPARRLIVVLLAGAVLLGAAIVGWRITASPGDPADEGVAVAESLAAAGSAEPTVPVPDRPVPGRSPSDGSVPDGSVPDGSVPVRLRIPALGIDARIVPVGVDPSTAEMAVPELISEVGWYRFGPGLDAPAGSTVLAGHVDDAEQGLGVFAELRELRPGDTMTVTGDDGVTRPFAVVAREVTAKSEVPLDRMFARNGAPRLTLVTCGGAFDRARRSYQDNVIVTAVPTSGSQPSRSADGG